MIFGGKFTKFLPEILIHCFICVFVFLWCEFIRLKSEFMKLYYIFRSIMLYGNIVYLFSLYTKTLPSLKFYSLRRRKVKNKKRGANLYQHPL